MLDTSLLRSPVRLLFLKALQKKQILVPAYVKRDGTVVAAHTKLVNWNPDIHAVLAGKSTFSHAEALKKLSKIPGFKELPPEVQHAHILSAAQDIQTAATKAAQVSVFRKMLLAGEKPGAANIAAFKELLKTDEKKAVAIRDEIIAAIGMDKFIDLVGWHADLAPPPPGPTEQEMAIATEKLEQIAAKAKGLYYPNLAWKKLVDSDFVVAGVELSNPVAKLQAVVDLAKQLQAEATQSAAISNLTTKLAEGKAPAPSEMKAYAALDDAAKLKAVVKAAKKAGLSIDVINALLDEGAKKAGLTVPPVEKVPLQSFMEKYGGQPVGTGPGATTFKFFDNKWHFWNTADKAWKWIANEVWQEHLTHGIHPATKLPLKVVPDPQAAPSQWVFNPADEGFSGAPTLTTMGPVPPGKLFYVTFSAIDGEWQVGSIEDGSDEAAFADYASPGAVRTYLQEQGVEPPSLRAIEDLAGPHEGDIKQGVGGLLVLKDGHWTLVASALVSFYVKHNINPTSATATAVVAALQGMGTLAPLEVESKLVAVKDAAKADGLPIAAINAMIEDLNATYAQTGGGPFVVKATAPDALVLKHGKWVVDPAGVAALYAKHNIKPGTPFALAVVAALQSAADKEPWSATMDALKVVKSVGLAQAWHIGEISDVIHDINAETAKMVVKETGAEPPAPFVDFGKKYPNTVFIDEAPGGLGFTLYRYSSTFKKWQASTDDGKTWINAEAISDKLATQLLPMGHGQYGLLRLHTVDANGNPQDNAGQVPEGGFGPANVGKVFAAVNMEFMYQVGVAAADLGGAAAGAWFTRLGDVEHSQWIPVTNPDYLSALDHGVNYTGLPLHETKPPAKAAHGFGPANAGKVFKVKLEQIGSTINVKYDGSAWVYQYENTPSDHWIKLADDWQAALDKGKDIFGKPLGGQMAGKGFGPRHLGEVFVLAPPSGDKAFTVSFKYTGEGPSGWWSMTGDPAAGAVWEPVGKNTPLSIQLDKGNDGSGTPLPAPPQEGDLKLGAHGWLVLKDGHWVKASPDEAPAGAPAAPASPYAYDHLLHFTEGTSNKFWQVTVDPEAKTATSHWGKIGTKGQSKTYQHATAKAAYEAAKKAAITKAKKGYVTYFLQDGAKQVASPQAKADLGLPPKAKPETGIVAQAAKPAAPPPAGVEDMTGWSNIGKQHGYNPGGTYRDENGDDWYCKFPVGGESVARNELLANRLYDAAGVGVPEVKLVIKGGTIGVASRIVKGAVIDKAALKAGKGEGLLLGFVADAWLANWDVVGNNPQSGWDNVMFHNGKAIRIDPGGALLYGGAGGTKTTFGSDVSELDTMRDPKINAQTAKVFGKISQADLQASAMKVLMVPDATISQLVDEFGPGDAAQKAALAKTLLERKANIAARFPKVVAKLAKLATEESAGPKVTAKKGKKAALDPHHLPVKPSDLPAPHDFMNWQGSGKPISEKPYVAHNIADEKAIFDFAMKGDLVALKQYKFQPVDKMTGAPVGEPKPISEHHSKYVKEYYDSVVTYLDIIANPPEPLKAFKGRAMDTIAALAKAFKPFNYGYSVAKVPPNQRLGFWIALGTVANPAHFQPVNVFKSITAAAKAKAYHKWQGLPHSVRTFLSAVQGSGSANQPYRDGKETDNQGQNCREVLTALYANATEHDEGFTIYKWIEMPSSMVQQIMSQPAGLVFQNPGSMCCTRSPEGTKGHGTHRIIMHYAKGAKAMDTFGSGEFENEQEVTSLPGMRCMVLKRELVPTHGGGGSVSTASGPMRLELETLMLPPDPTYVENIPKKTTGPAA